MTFLHKVTRKLINKNQIDTFCLERLDVKGMLQNRSLAQAISDVSWRKFVHLLAGGDSLSCIPSADGKLIEMRSSVYYCPILSFITRNMNFVLNTR